MKRQQGFTIIEVVLVLAVAALIFLMVFIALPSLQKGQRDTQRRSDLARIATQLTNYSTSNRGAIPSSGDINSFVSKYLGGSGTTAGSEYVDPSTGMGYTFTVTTSDPSDLGTVNYQTGVICGTDGATTTSGASGRSYALRTKLENQGAPYCIDNRQ